MRRLGHVEGENLTVQRYGKEENTAGFDALAAEVVRSNPDVVLSIGAGSLQMKAATTMIPLVIWDYDPLGRGLTKSLAHPGGNITGVASDAGWQLYEKWIELLKELVPKLSSVFFLASQPHWEGRETSVAVREGAKRTGTSLIPIPAGRCATCLQ